MAYNKNAPMCRLMEAWAEELKEEGFIDSFAQAFAEEFVKEYTEVLSKKFTEALTEKLSEELSKTLTEERARERKNDAQEIAKGLLREGSFSIEKIAALTGLLDNEVREIKGNLNL